MSRRESIQVQINRLQDWFEIELSCGPANKLGSDRFKLAISREIQKSLRDDEFRVKVALLTLTLSGFVKDPRKFTEVDIDNALWLVRDLQIGFDENAPISMLLG